MSTEKYLETNKESWNNRVESHVNSDFYNQSDFMKGKNSLNSFELDLLGDVNGKSILHLQCHFGQDTISLSKMGAQATGVDFSDEAIKKGQVLAQTLGTDTRFIQSDIYDLPNHLNEKFDYVFTSYGTIGWLPNVDQWAKVVAHFLKPGGTFIIVDFHPVVWMFDDNFEKVHYNYFNVEPILETSEGTYADTTAELKLETVTWNHPISETLTSLLSNGLEIQAFQEFDYSPYNCFQKTIEFEPGKFRIEHMDNKLPMVYAIKAVKK